MDKWYVYIIECQGTHYYTGITNNVGRRLEMHSKNKGAKYTRGRQPIELMAFWEFESKSEASKREYVIKKLSKKQKEELINSYKNNGNR